MKNGGNSSWWRVLELKNVVDILFVEGFYFVLAVGIITSFSEQGRPLRESAL